MSENSHGLQFSDEYLDFLKLNDISLDVYEKSQSIPRFIRINPRNPPDLQLLESELNTHLHQLLDKWRARMDNFSGTDPHTQPQERIVPPCHWAGPLLRATPIPDFYMMPSCLNIASTTAVKNAQVYGLDIASALCVLALGLTGTKPLPFTFPIQSAPSTSTQDAETDSQSIQIPALDATQQYLRAPQVLDICCAPGAKTALAADLLRHGFAGSRRNTSEFQATDSGKQKIPDAWALSWSSAAGTVTGVDISVERMHKCKRLLEKYNVSNTRLFQADACLFRVPAPLAIWPANLKNCRPTNETSSSSPNSESTSPILPTLPPLFPPPWIAGTWTQAHSNTIRTDTLTAQQDITDTQSDSLSSLSSSSSSSLSMHENKAIGPHKRPRTADDSMMCIQRRSRHVEDDISRYAEEDSDADETSDDITALLNITPSDLLRPQLPSTASKAILSHPVLEYMATSTSYVRGSSRSEAKAMQGFMSRASQGIGAAYAIGRAMARGQGKDVADFGKNVRKNDVLNGHGNTLDVKLFMSDHNSNLIASHEEKPAAGSYADLLADAQLETQKYDFVMVDAECTHDGSVRHLEKHAKQDWQDISVVCDNDRVSSLPLLQRRLLASGWRCLRDGGVLVYSTCSFSRRQNEDICAWLAMEAGAVVVDASEEIREYVCEIDSREVVSMDASGREENDVGVGGATEFGNLKIPVPFSEGKLRFKRGVDAPIVDWCDGPEKEVWERAYSDVNAKCMRFDPDVGTSGLFICKFIKRSRVQSS